MKNPVNLFAALNMATGHVQVQTTQTKTREDFQCVMDQVMQDLPEDKEVQMILDNDCTHKKINQNRYLCLNGLGTKVGM
jgi:hypothetical protein